MKYAEKSFTLPASNVGTSQINWDRAFLSTEEFAAKYPDNIQENEYEVVELCLGCNEGNCDSCPCGTYKTTRKKRA